MPESMRKNYPNHAATFDCFEVATEIPSKVAHSVLAYSHYKSGFTIKVLGATSAAGVFMFMSEGKFFIKSMKNISDGRYYCTDYKNYLDFFLRLVKWPKIAVKKSQIFQKF